MKISDPKSDWYIPPDWRFILSWHFIIMPAVILTTMFALALPSTAVEDLTLLWVALLVGAIGVGMLFFARLPLYRQRKCLSFGPGALPASHRKLYWVAYGFIVVSIVIMAALQIALAQ